MVLHALRSLVFARRSSRMPALATWYDELDRLERQLADDPGNEWAWMWRIRRKVLAFLIADRPVRYVERRSHESPEPAPPKRGIGTARLDAARARQPVSPPPERRLLLHHKLHDLLEANEPRHLALRDSGRAARLERLLRLHEYELRRFLARLDPVAHWSRSAIWQMRPTASVERVHACLRRARRRACPACGRWLIHPPPVYCARCGHHVTAPPASVDGLIRMLTTAQDLPAGSIRPTDRLVDLVARRCVAEEGGNEGVGPP